MLYLIPSIFHTKRLQSTVLGNKKGIKPTADPFYMV